MSAKTGSMAASLSGSRKAAILMIALGEETAGHLLQHLTSREVARLAKEVAEIDAVEDDVVDSVLQEYYLAAMNAPSERGGPELARKLLAKASIPQDLVDQLLGPELEPAEEVLGPLLESQPPTLARALEEEHPQTTALVLLHLPASRAAAVLAALPEESRSETLLRMTSLREVKGEVLGDVANALHERLAEVGVASETTDGIDRTAAMLGKLPRSDMKLLLEKLEQAHPEEADLLRSKVFTFESLANVEDRGLQELLRQVETQNLALALNGCPDSLLDRFTANLSERAAGMLREEIEFLGKVKPEDQASARKEIIDTVLTLEGEGKLEFIDEDGEN